MQYSFIYVYSLIEKIYSWGQLYSGGFRPWLKGCTVGADLSRSTFVLRNTDAIAFVPRKTNGTSNVYPKKLICVTNVLRSSFLRDKKAHLSHDF
jgi:hypothetical protein